MDDVDPRVWFWDRDSCLLHPRRTKFKVSVIKRKEHEAESNLEMSWLNISQKYTEPILLVKPILFPGSSNKRTGITLLDSTSSHNECDADDNDDMEEGEDNDPILAGGEY